MQSGRGVGVSHRSIKGSWRPPRALVWVLFCPIGCLAPPVAERDSTTIGSSFSVERETEPTLGPDDVLRVTVIGHSDLSTPEVGARVDLNGWVSLPLIGPVRVADLTPDRARQEIEDRFTEYVREPSVTLSLVDHGSKRVFVLGHVVAPGEYVLDGPRSALQALTFSGGFLPGSDRENIAILRPLAGGEIDVHLFNAATPGVDGLVQVRSGDLLFIRQSGSGTFTEQVAPIITTLSTAFSASTSVLTLLDRMHITTPPATY